MRKVLTLTLCILSALSSFAALTPKPSPGADHLFVRVSSNGQTMSLWELSHITKKDFQLKTGSKLSFFAGLQFRLTQKKLRSLIQKGGTINIEKVQEEVSNGFHLGGFALGLLLGPIGVIIAYLIKDKHRQQRIKYAWCGFLTYAVVGVLALLIFNFSSLK